MNLRELGLVVIVNNLRSQNPDTAADVQALTAALETVGFKVKCYDDCNAQVSLRRFLRVSLLFKILLTASN